MCLSVPGWAHSSKPSAAGLLLWAQLAGDDEWLLLGTQQHSTWHANVHSSMLSADTGQHGTIHRSPVWARGRCRISPPRFLAECCKRQLNQVGLVLLYFRLSAFSDLYWVCLSVFSCTVFLSVSVKWLAVKTASEMTYTVSGGALNSTQTKTKLTQEAEADLLNYASCRWRFGTFASNPMQSRSTAYMITCAVSSVHSTRTTPSLTSSNASGATTIG